MARTPNTKQIVNKLAVVELFDQFQQFTGNTGHAQTTIGTITRIQKIDSQYLVTFVDRTTRILDSHVILGIIY